LGNARAFQLLDFGSAACRWSALVKHKELQIIIQAPAAGYEVNGRTSDRTSCAKAMLAIRSLAPIKAILATFMFDE
jgi:hypothetical protein